MLKKFLFVILIKLSLLFSVDVYGGSFAKYGLGILNSAEHSKTETKVLSLGYADDWFGPFMYQLEAGGFSDSAGNGRTGSGFGFVSSGVEVNTGTVVLRSLLGVGAITSPDSMLGGWFEFTEDVLLGIRDRRGNMIGMNYKHISSAGIYAPNRGRDFLTLQVEIPW